MNEKNNIICLRCRSNMNRDLLTYFDEIKGILQGLERYDLLEKQEFIIREYNINVRRDNTSRN